MDRASRTDPDAALQPPVRSADHTERNAKPIVAAPHNVRTTTRNAPCGAVTADMSLMVWATAASSTDNPSFALGWQNVKPPTAGEPQAEPTA